MVYDRLRWEEKSLYEEARKMGVQAGLVDAKLMVYDSRDGGFNLDLGDVVYVRCISHFRAQMVSAIIESAGYTCVNTHSVLETCSNKLLTTLALKRHGIPTPRTLMAFSAEGVNQAAQTLGYPLVLKPLVGSWGRLVALARDGETLKALVEHREELGNPLDHLYYLQEYVSRPPRDIRAVVVGGEVVAVVYRVSAEGEWRTNVARGATTEALQPSEELAELLARSAEAVGGGILGVDAMESGGGYLVHEVNGTVEFRGAQSAVQNSIPRKIVEHLVREVKK
ncbi:MAG: lysine biosynthesis protein LysX [Thermoprotei archaeon]